MKAQTLTSIHHIVFVDILTPYSCHLHSLYFVNYLGFYDTDTAMLATFLLHCTTNINHKKYLRKKEPCIPYLHQLCLQQTLLETLMQGVAEERLRGVACHE
jgi:hypothetical protein